MGSRYKKSYEFIDLSLKKKLEKELESREEEETKKRFKICLICKMRKSLFSFSVDRRSRDNRNGACKICKSRQSSEYYYLHKEEILIRAKEYRENNPRDRSKYLKNYQRDNKERLKKIAAAWYKKNKKAIKKRNLKYYEENKEACQAIRKLWLKNHKEEIKKYNREYKKLKSKGGDKMLRKSKKGFTLIELMVVVVIIGVLAVIGLRFYSGQVEKAKDAVTKANVGTIQTLIQAELSSRSVTDLDVPGELSEFIFANAGIHNSVTGAPQTACPADEAGAGAGEVWVTYSSNVFQINGRNTKDDDNVFANSLRAIK